MKIACIQIDIAFGQPELNYSNVEKEINKVMIEEKPDVIVLPELWTTGYDLTRLDEIADINGEKTIELMSRLSAFHHVNIVAGSVAKRVDNHTWNTMYMFNREGQVTGEYSKLHLFKLMDEHLYLESGSEKGLFSLDGIQVAGLICYDIRFPEWIRAHTVVGAEIIFVVAEWPMARLHHWRSLLISRAIENQCFVVACNRAGEDPNNIFAGHSLIIDPWGEVLVEATEKQETIVQSIEMGMVAQVRRQIPIFQDRKPSFY